MYIQKTVCPRLALIALLALLTTIVPLLEAQAPQAASAKSRILLVLPFDNRTGLANLEWIREAAATVVSDRLRSAGFAPLSRPDRDYAFDHLGLPTSFQPSRASSLKLADTLDAESIVVGDFINDGTDIVAEARLLDVPHLKMGPRVTARGQMRDLIGVFGSLSWQLTRQLDPNYPVAEQTFTAAGSGVRVEAFEQYIRGIMETDQAERLRHLKQAVTVSPEFAPAWFALGKQQYASQQYEQAAQSFSHVTGRQQEALEAGFQRGLALIFSGDYAQAETAFAGVARALPLAEVLNNQGVALTRRGKDGTDLFRQAAAADPNDADYHFNLALGLRRKGETTAALNELAECRKLRPGDTEAEAVEATWSGKRPASSAETVSAAGTKVEPLERIKRSFNAPAFRQAAAMMDQMDSAKLSALSPRDRAKKLASQAEEDLGHSMLLEAERLSQEAVAADANVAAGHQSLAEVRERAGDNDTARKEARAAIDLDPTAPAYLVLARLDLAAGKLDAAANEAEAALKLDGGSRAAQDLVKRIQSAQSEQK